MIVFMAFTSSGTMAQEFGAAPAPSSSMKSAGMSLQVPALLAANAKAIIYNFPKSYKLEELTILDVGFITFKLNGRIRKNKGSLEEKENRNLFSLSRKKHHTKHNRTTNWMQHRSEILETKSSRLDW
ncbi:hypothetical protein Tco_0254991 [Tanacetum coccineum]